MTVSYTHLDVYKRQDMDKPYVTYDDNFIESEWWALKEIWNKGLLYKGFKIVPYCPRCGTPVSYTHLLE